MFFWKKIKNFVHWKYVPKDSLEFVQYLMFKPCFNFDYKQVYSTLRFVDILNVIQNGISDENCCYVDE